MHAGTGLSKGLVLIRAVGRGAVVLVHASPGLRLLVQDVRRRGVPVRQCKSKHGSDFLTCQHNVIFKGE